MAYLFRGRSNVTSTNDLEDITNRKCGSEINLQRMPMELFSKLIDILKSVVLTKLTLRECFVEPKYMFQILQALGNNSRIKELELDVRENSFDEHCTLELTKIISKRSIKSLELPRDINQSICEDILREILTSGSRIEILNITGAVLTEVSIDCLEQLIKDRRVTDQLVLKYCQAPRGSMLTRDDRDKLKTAEKSTRRLFGKLRMIKIFWFDFVEHADIDDIDDLNPGEWEVVSLPPPPIYCTDSPCGAIAMVLSFMVRKKTEKMWKLVNGRRRRVLTQSDTRGKVRIQEVDELADCLGKHSVDNSASNDSTHISTEHSTPAPISVTQSLPYTPTRATTAFTFSQPRPIQCFTPTPNINVQVFNAPGNNNSSCVDTGANSWSNEEIEYFRKKESQPKEVPQSDKQSAVFSDGNGKITISGSDVQVNAAGNVWNGPKSYRRNKNKPKKKEGKGKRRKK